VNEGVIILTVDTNVLVPMTEANQNFSKVVRIVEENGMAVILKNNVPRYMVLSFKEYDEIMSARQRLFNEAADSIISENLEALKVLAE
jgi:antitoxin Phd